MKKRFVPETKGLCPSRRQAVSPGFRASLVQPSAALRPFRFAPRVGDPPRLASATPALAGEGLEGVSPTKHPNSIPETTRITMQNETLKHRPFHQPKARR